MRRMAGGELVAARVYREWDARLMQVGRGQRSTCSTVTMDTALGRLTLCTVFLPWTRRPPRPATRQSPRPPRVRVETLLLEGGGRRECGLE